jgi:hypothetical protein
MTNFSDQLFADLMREHGPALRAAELTPGSSRRDQLRRGAWLAGGAGTLAVGITVGLTAFGGTASAAYAVTPHPDGTVTVEVTDLSGVAGANSRLHSLGSQVVVVPVKDGCPSMAGLPAPSGKASGPVVAVSGAATRHKDGDITVQARGIPAGDVLVVAVASDGHGTTMAARMTTAPAPACVSGAGVPAPGSGVVRGHGPTGVFSGPVRTGPDSRPGASAAAG